MAASTLTDIMMSSHYIRVSVGVWRHEGWDGDVMEVIYSWAFSLCIYICIVCSLGRIYLVRHKNQSLKKCLNSIQVSGRFDDGLHNNLTIAFNKATNHCDILWGVVCLWASSITFVLHDISFLFCLLLVCSFSVLFFGVIKAHSFVIGLLPGPCVTIWFLAHLLCMVVIERSSFCSI